MRKATRPRSRKAGRTRVDAVRRAWQRNRLILRTWLLFLLIFVGSLTAFLYSGDAVRDRTTSWTAWLTAEMLRLLSIDARARGDELISSVSSVTIIFECTAVFPCILLLSAILAYPAPLRSKLLGLAWGIPALLAINQIRLISLVLILGWIPAAFPIAHLVVWQSLIVVATLALWGVWTSRLGEIRRVRVPR